MMSEQNTIYNASAYTINNKKFANLLCVPVEEYLNINKIVLPTKDENRKNVVQCLDFICENFVNLVKLKFVIVRGKDNDNICNESFFKSFVNIDEIMTNKIALLQKILFVRVCFRSKYTAERFFYGQSSCSALNSKNNLAYSYMNNMIIFNSDDDLVLPTNITKLNIVGGKYNLQKILNNFEMGLTDLTVTINKNQINLLNLLNLPSTITKINLFMCISEYKNIQIDKQEYGECVEEYVKINEIRSRIKIPHNCELNIMFEIGSDMDYTSESDDIDFYEFNDFNDEQV